jgi:periplasmic protein CpxP/Spy
MLGVKRARDTARVRFMIAMIERRRIMQVRKFLALGLPLLVGSLGVINPGLLRAADEEPATAAAEQNAPDAQGQHRHDPSAHVQKRLARLKSDLRITPEQEPQWSAFSNTVMQQVEQFKAAHQGAKPRSMKAPERIDRQVEMMKQRVASFEQVAQAAKTLYASLAPDQQQIADQRLLKFHHHRAG